MCEMLRACHEAGDFSLVPELRPPKTKHSPNTPHSPTHSHGQKRNRHGNSSDGNSSDGKSSECHPPGHSHACHQAHVSDRPLPAGQGDGTVTQATQCTVTQATQCSRAHESDGAPALGRQQGGDSTVGAAAGDRRQDVEETSYRAVSCVLHPTYTVPQVYTAHTWKTACHTLPPCGWLSEIEVDRAGERGERGERGLFILSPTNTQQDTSVDGCILVDGAEERERQADGAEQQVLPSCCQVCRSATRWQDGRRQDASAATRWQHVSRSLLLQASTPLFLQHPSPLAVPPTSDTCRCPSRWAISHKTLTAGLVKADVPQCSSQVDVPQCSSQVKTHAPHHGHELHVQDQTLRKPSWGCSDWVE